jgi:hypothetical protein
VSAVWYCSNCLPLVLTPVTNLLPVSTTPVVPVAKCDAIVIVDTVSSHWLADISDNFIKKFKMTLMLFLGAWGKMIHEKNLKQKMSWHCPFKFCVIKGERTQEKLFFVFFSLSC